MLLNTKNIIHVTKEMWPLDTDAETTNYVYKDRQTGRRKHTCLYGHTTKNLWNRTECEDRQAYPGTAIDTSDKRVKDDDLIILFCQYKSNEGLY